jgi:hypothetical protein
VAPVKKMKDVFVLHPILNKNLSWILKTISFCLEYFPKIDWSKLAKKKRFFGFFWVSGFAGESGFGWTPLRW